MEELSTQTDYNSISLEDAVAHEDKARSIQNHGTLMKHGFRRRLGKLVGDIEDTEGVKARKKVAEKLQIPWVILRQSINEAAVSEEDYQRYIRGTLIKFNGEITNAGALRAGKTRKNPRLVSAAVRVHQKLSPWIDSLLIKSLLIKDYAGSEEELNQAVEVLEVLSKEFAEVAKQLKER